MKEEWKQGIKDEMGDLIKVLPYSESLPDEEINFGEENWNEDQMNVPWNFTLK